MLHELRLKAHTVLPAQFYAARATSPEKRLMLAVLKDALDTYRTDDGPANRKRARVIRETEAWLFSDDTSWPFSFANVCDAVGIDIGWLRAQLRQP